MPDFYPTEWPQTAPPTRPSDVGLRGKMFVTRNTFVLATQLVTDFLFCGRLPAGSRFSCAMFNSSVSLTTSTLQLGTRDAAGAFTAKHTPVVTYGTTANVVTWAASVSAQDDGPLSADETVWADIGVASLPAAGSLIVDLFYYQQ